MARNKTRKRVELMSVDFTSREYQSSKNWGRPEKKISAKFFVFYKKTA
jgi:hypothetical protein